jgi:ribosomal protein L15
VVPVGALAAAGAGAVVDRAWLEAHRLARRPGPVKLLAGGELPVPITVKVDAASAAARRIVEAAGGKVETPATSKA